MLNNSYFFLICVLLDYLNSYIHRNYIFSVGIASGLIALFSTGTQ